MDICEFGKLANIVIIDDKKAEGNRIKKALDSLNVPSVFYHIKNNDCLPDKPLNNLRIVFLDLNFSESNGFASPSQRAGIALSKLSRFVSEDSFYVLIVWSSHTTMPVYTEFCRQLEREDSIPQPIRHFSMDKSISWDPTGIIDAINEKFEEIPLFRVFSEWERMVGIAVSKSLSSIVSWKLDNNGLSKLINSLAGAYGAGDHPHDKTLRDALWSFDGVLSDNLSGEIAKSDFWDLHQKIETLKDDKGRETVMLTSPEKSAVNARLFLSRDLSFAPGIIFEEDLFSSFIQESVVNAPSVGKGVVINITPLCDHAQGKNRYHYFVHWALVSRTDGAAPNYKSNLPSFYKVGDKSFNFNWKETILIVDIASKFSKDKSEVEDRTPIAKLRDNLVIDIQHKVAAHQSRPGHVLL